jgi:hypothetical protein
MNSFWKGCIGAAIGMALFMWMGWGIRGSHTVTAETCREVVNSKGGTNNLCTSYTVKFTNVSGKLEDMDAMADKIISAMQAMPETK